MVEPFPHLFSPLRVRTLTLKNRIFSSVDADAAYFQHTTSGEAIVCEGVETVVLALGHQPETGLEAALADFPGPVIPIGDCLSPRTAEEAVLEGLKAAVAL